MEILKSMTRAEANEKFARDCQEGLNLSSRGYETFKAFAEKAKSMDFQQNVKVAVELGGLGFSRDDLKKVIDNNITYSDVRVYVNHPYEENHDSKIYKLDTICREFARLFYLFNYKYLFLANGEDFMTVA